jgi:hypothetical protein
MTNLSAGHDRKIHGAKPYNTYKEEEEERI